MTRFLTGALSVIAVGVLLIAYGLLSGRAAAYVPNADMDRLARPTLANEGVTLNGDPARGNPYPARYGSAPYAYPPAAAAEAGVARPVRTSEVVQAPQRVVRAAPKRDWRKTALVIGGSSAAAAGIGAAFGGKKGALIGAAIGGGASTLFEATKD